MNKVQISCLMIAAIGLSDAGVAQQPNAVGPVFEVPIVGTRKTEADYEGWTLIVDNDLFASDGKDQDYSGGIGVSLHGYKAATLPFSLDPALSWINKRLDIYGRLESITPKHMLQFGLLTFTPEDLETSTPVFDDRPYANLLFLENSQFHLDASANRAYQTTLTLGILGSNAAETIQNSIHRVSDGIEPTGYGYQISNGGELTARYAVARQSLLLSGSSDRGRTFDLKYGLEGDIGYLTEGSVTLAARWGRISSPWWSFATSRSNYLPQAVPKSISVSPGGGGREFYFWGALTMRARAYNAFLQGQFRDSAVTFSTDELNHGIAELSIGLTVSFSNSLTADYALHYQTKEIKHGVGARTPLWGGVTISRHF